MRPGASRARSYPCRSRRAVERIGPRGVKLLLRGTGKGTTKSLSFAPGLTNLFRKTSEPGCHLYDDECDHGYRPALTSRRLI